jgi:rubrerythrin
MSLQTVEGIINQVIQVEKAGADFYRKLAGETRLQAAKDVFLKLFKDEVSHQKDFTDLAGTIKGKGLSLESAINLTEVMMRTVGKIQASLKGSELVNMDEVGLKQALDIGIQNEREAIRIYSELLTLSNLEFTMIVRKVIEEERKHLTVLENLKAQRLA